MSKRINKWAHATLLKIKIKNMLTYFRKMKNAVTTISKSNKMIKLRKIYLKMKKASLKI